MELWNSIFFHLSGLSSRVTGLARLIKKSAQCIREAGGMDWRPLQCGQNLLGPLAAAE